MVSANKAAHSIAWTIGTGLGSRIVGLVGTLVLTRYLSPNDVGEVSAAHVIVLSTMQFLTFGVGVYLVADPKTGRDVAFHATVIQIGTGLIGAGVAYAARYRMGATVDAPGLVRYVPGMALALMIARVAYMPERMLVRQMKFRRLGLSRALGELSLPIVAVATARAGAGGYALVYGNLANATVSLIMMSSAVSWREWLEPHRLRLSTFWTLIRYGTWSSLSTLADTAARRWDNLVVSRLYGAGVMGAYNMAYNLADVPSIQVGEQVTDVLLSSLANMEKERRVGALTRAAGLLGLIIFPLAIGLGAVATTMTRAFLAPQWWMVGPMLAILSGLAVVRPLTGAVLSYLQVCLRLRAVMIIEWATVAFVLLSLVTLGRLSPLWACTAIGVAFTARLVVSLEVLRRSENVPVAPILTRQIGPLVATIPMIAAAYGVHRGFVALGLGQLHGVRAGGELMAQIAAGGLAYVGACFVVARSMTLELIVLIRNLVSGRERHE
ncbi:MAG TPA: oligosaccharide flippase family protein [Polyangia bacterium]